VYVIKKIIYKSVVVVFFLKYLWWVAIIYNPNSRLIFCNFFNEI